MKEKENYNTYEIQHMIKWATAVAYARGMVTSLIEQKAPETAVNVATELTARIEKRYQAEVPENVRDENSPLGRCKLVNSPKDLIALLEPQQ
jgi:hypothetical protein